MGILTSNFWKTLTNFLLCIVVCLFFLTSANARNTDLNLGSDTLVKFAKYNTPIEFTYYGRTGMCFSYWVNHCQQPWVFQFTKFQIDTQPLYGTINSITELNKITSPADRHSNVVKILFTPATNPDCVDIFKASSVSKKSPPPPGFFPVDGERTPSTYVIYSCDLTVENTYLGTTTIYSSPRSYISGPLFDSTSDFRHFNLMINGVPFTREKELGYKGLPSRVTDKDGNDITHLFSFREKYSSQLFNSEQLCGPQTFTYHYSDQEIQNSGLFVKGFTAKQDFLIINCGPSFYGQTLITDEDTSVTVLPSSNVQGSASLEFITQPLNGTVTLNPNNYALTYTPHPNYCGADTFTAKLTDDSGTSEAATFPVSVTCVYDPPFIGGGQFSGLEDTPIDVRLRVSYGDTENGKIEDVFYIKPPSHGTFLVEGKKHTYTPDPNYCGQDEFEVKLTTTSGAESNIATVGIDVTCVIDIPVLNDKTVSVVEDTPIAFGVTLDLDGGAISDRHIDSLPSNGAATWVNNQLKYTPSANFCGSDSFTASITTQAGKSSPATFTMNVSCVVDKPVLNGKTVSVVEDTPIAFDVTLDLDGGAISDRHIDSLPSNGAATWVNNQLKYTPSANFCGSDSFTASITTQAGKSSPATFTMNVSCVVDKPVLNGKTVSVVEDTPIAFGVTLDLDGGAISDRHIDSLPSNGAATWVNNQLKYTPSANFCGSDSFTASITTQAGKSSPATFTMNVSCVVDKPVLNGKTVSVVEDTPIAFDVTLDLDGGAISDRHIDSLPSNGAATWVNNQLKYTPSANFCGSDSFTASITTQAGKSSPATFTMNVSCVVDKPVLNGKTVSVVEDTPIAFGVTLDLDGGAISDRHIDSLPSNGAATWVNNQLKYTPSANFCGSDSFTASITTQAGKSSPATFTMNVSCVVDKPVLNGKTVSVVEDTTISFGVSHDLDGGAISDRHIDSLPSNGAATWVNNQLKYTPSANFCGSDSFTASITTQAGKSSPATFTMNVSCVVDKPVLNGKTVSVVEDTPIAFGVTLDLDGGAISDRHIDSLPSNGAATWVNNQLKYTPSANFCGSDSFTASITTQAGKSSPATFTMNVSCVVDKPVLNGKTVSVVEDTPIAFGVTLDLDGGAISDRHIDSLPSNGAATWVNNQLKYTPSANFCGSDSFTASITTQAGKSSPATFTMNVSCVVDKPVLNGKTVSVVEDTTISFGVSHDLDGGAISDRHIDSLPSNGAATWVNNQLKYTPSANFCGSDSFTASITTQAGKSSPATFTMNVSCVVDKPVLNGKTVSVVEDTPIAFGVTLDLDGGAISDRHIDSLPSNGAATWVNNQLKYTPSADFCGSDSFTASITTQGGQSSPATFSMNVSCVIDAAVITDINATVVEDENAILPTPRIELDGGSVAQYLITTNAQHGQAFWQGGNLHYNPSTDYCGIDQFYYQVRTEAGLSNIAKAHLVVSCVNDAPTLVLTNKITFDIATGEHHVDYHVLDVDDNTVSAAISGLPAFIKHSFNAKQGRFTINESGQLAGEYLISVNVSDGQYGDEGFITIRIEDNRPINITQPNRTTLAATQIIRHTDNEPTNALKAVNITNIMGELITGNIAITVSASAGSISSEVAGKRLNPGSSVTFDYTVNEPGVIEVFVKPEREGTLNLSLSTDVNQ